MYRAPSHLRKLCKSTDKNTKSTIEHEYGDYITVFTVVNFSTKIHIGFDNSDHTPTGQIVGFNNNGDSTILFDLSKHGYNGMYQLEELITPSMYKEHDLSSDELIIALQYGGEEKDYANENGGKAEDYYDWIVFYEKTGDSLDRIVEFECA